ncbi:tautomerase [Fructilactobacillus lindneri]|uniref:Tautomerase n=1 Tax=Fructilactobacillus lindneri TaxID=53444 RepID=A0AB33BT69_9LACO|nr:tautomerase [Fructilactobacillus lindneri]POH23294.1 tautomerase [Fructilactobacillus lindneri DSM 20690 = JCM 11027]ANZ58650.1 tautomerase [Fructilactobacillus lindneri]POG97944.1 tautomerase [Fructilactobacillus lindneri]POG99276.1 tautomerase [Fructilactobacillus lindneri]
MPLMRIDMVKGQRTPEEIQKVMQLAYDLTRKDLGVPEDDRFQVVTQHESYEMKLMDAGLGINRSDDVILFQILSTPRTMGQKKFYCKDMVEAFGREMNMRPEDVMIVFATNHAEDWSFGHGKQQFLDGEL